MRRVTPGAASMYALRTTHYILKHPEQQVILFIMGWLPLCGFPLAGHGREIHHILPHFTPLRPTLYNTFDGLSSRETAPNFGKCFREVWDIGAVYLMRPAHG